MASTVCITECFIKLGAGNVHWLLPTTFQVANRAQSNLTASSRQWSLPEKITVALTGHF